MKLPEIDTTRLPKHVAIIMDGNGRWAKKNGVGRAAGHEAGAKSVRAAVEACRELGGIESLTLYAFSTENWRRSKVEVETLFRLLSKYIKIEIDNIHKEDIRVVFMGRLEALSARARRDIEYSMDLTRNNKSMLLCIAMNYGARSEIVDATRAIAAEVKSGALKEEDIDEACFARHLYTPEVANLDLMIRTSGEMRVSNFLLWQLSYAEFAPLAVLWPDFRKQHLYEAIAQYQARDRRFGGR